jgi:hypothetical protein
MYRPPKKFRNQRLKKKFNYFEKNIYKYKINLGVVLVWVVCRGLEKKEVVKPVQSRVVAH